MTEPAPFTPTWSIEAKAWKALNPEHASIPDVCPACGDPLAVAQVIDATVYRGVWFRSDGTIEYGDSETAYDEPYGGDYICELCEAELDSPTCRAIDAALKAGGVMPGGAGASS